MLAGSTAMSTALTRTLASLEECTQGHLTGQHAARHRKSVMLHDAGQNVHTLLTCFCKALQSWYVSILWLIVAGLVGHRSNMIDF